MEANGMTLADFATLEKVGNRHRGISGTALGFGVGALALGIAGLWGVMPLRRLVAVLPS